MPTLIISGPAQAFADDPHGSKPITDRATLLRFHGLVSDEACADLFEDADLEELGLSEGFLRFIVDDKAPVLRITTAYHVPQRLTDKETQLVVEATTSQWSDGCGSGSFENFYGPVLSTAYAMAMLNAGNSQEDIGEYFVDAFPFLDNDEKPRVEFVKADVEKTDLDYLQEAAAWGEPQAQFQLGRQLEDGEEIEKNERLAFDYYKKAAKQNHLLALTHAGLCFQTGTGIAQDLERGYKCFVKAAHAGEPKAMHALGECYLEGRGIEADPDEGIKWYRRGIELDDVGCMAELGDCYEFGKGVPQDLRQALELYERCMEDGFDAVEPALRRVRKQLKRSGDK